MLLHYYAFARRSSCTHLQPANSSDHNAPLTAQSHTNPTHQESNNCAEHHVRDTHAKLQPQGQALVGCPAGAEGSLKQAVHGLGVDLWVGGW